MNESIQGCYFYIFQKILEIRLKKFYDSLKSIVPLNAVIGELVWLNTQLLKSLTALALALSL